MAKELNKDVFRDLRLIEVALTNRLKELDSLEDTGNWSEEYKGERVRVKKELRTYLEDPFLAILAIPI